ncbi:MAG TPA: GNAT family N-acetyltransferase [Arenibaculum sp.]|nr:GNAT family N-acetyltransferase [Arenibaculum sp.]
MVDLQDPFRRAGPGDARRLAELIDIAGEGIPSLLWGEAAQPGESALDVGERRAARTGCSFSYENAVVGESGGDVVCMLLGYPIDDTDPGDLSGLPEIVRPLVRLECKAPGTWYVNALAVLDGHRGRGFGTRLLAIAQICAAEAGRPATSLIVAGNNAGARRLYDQAGYREIAGEPAVPHPRLHAAGRWLLMTRPVG